MSLNPFAFNRLFQSIIHFCDEKYGENEYSIKSYSIDSPCAAGDNFLSEIYAIKFEIQLKSPQNCRDSNVEDHELIAKSQIVDAESDTDVRRYMFNIIFTKERLVYSDVLERMQSLLGEMGGLDKQPSLALAPKMHTFYTEGETYSCILMDNLVSNGFYTPQTHGAGVSLDECNSIMKAMARFHALSLVMEAQDQVPFPEKHQICSAEFLLSSQTEGAMKQIVKGSFEGLTDLAEKYRPDLVPLLTCLDKEEDVWDRLLKLVKPGLTSFSCLCHGDPRLNNIFVDRENAENVRFIDFQLTRYCSPMTDLQYILNMGATGDFRKKYRDEVLLSYFQEFTSIINSFPEIKLLASKEEEVRGWTLEKLNEEYDQMTMYGFLISIVLLPLILLRPEDMDKPVAQMGKEERERFWNEGRKDLVFQLGCNHTYVRDRLFDICDEAFAVINSQK